MTRHTIKRVLTLWLMILLTSVWAVSAGVDRVQTSGGNLVLTRVLEGADALPGQSVALSFEIKNSGTDPLGYTLIEEIPVGMTVVDSGEGRYNRTAGFIVWPGQIGAGETITLPYIVEFQPDQPEGVLPLYAHINASDGTMLELEKGIVIRRLPVQLVAGSTLAKVDESTTVRLEITNPLQRLVSLDLIKQTDQGLTVESAFPDNVHLAAGETRTFDMEVTAKEAGHYELGVQPAMAGVAVSGPLSVGITYFDGQVLPVMDDWAEDDDAGAVIPMVTTERVHQLHIPAPMLDPEKSLFLAVPIPLTAGYVPDTALIDETLPIEPRISGDYFLFPLPAKESMEVRYQLLYSGDGPTDEQPADAHIGLISVGETVRVLHGPYDLLSRLDRHAVEEERERVGLVILEPVDGQLFTERKQIDVVVDSPMGSEAQLLINGEEVSKAQVGAIGEDEPLQRYTEKYIAIRLETGRNEIQAIATDADGELLTDTITVYRPGPISQIQIEPVSELHTGSVHPLKVRITATDKDGFPPADGISMAVELEGSTLITADAHPDWVGHQVLLYGGESILEIAPVDEATRLMVRAFVGETTAERELLVTTMAESWFVTGQAAARVERLLSPDSSTPDYGGHVRFFARGPVGDWVLTAAMDSDGLDEVPWTSPLWTGDAASQGSFEGASGPLFARIERELSYVQLGRGAIELKSGLTPYNKSHSGLQAVWHGEGRLSGLTARAFYAREAQETFEQVFPGDGTSYFRLSGPRVKPYSEQLSIVVRDAFPPHQVIKETSLSYGDYRLDDQTGQVFLAKPLPATDEDGHLQSLRVRYVPQGVAWNEDVAGFQTTLDRGPLTLRGMAVQGVSQHGVKPFALSVSGEWESGDLLAEAEVAASESFAGRGMAYELKLNHPKLLGWQTAWSHRYVEPAFTPVDRSGADVSAGRVTTLRAARQSGSLRWMVTGALGRAHDAKEVTADSSVGVSWRMGFARPQLELKLRREGNKPVTAGASAGIGMDFRRGSVTLKREQSLIGEGPTRHEVAGMLQLGHNTEIHVSAGTERPAGGAEEKSTLSWGLTHVLGRDSKAETTLKSGYEMSDGASGRQSAMVYEVATEWTPTDKDAIGLTLDHKRPLLVDQPGSLGGSVSWTRRMLEAESVLRLDYYRGEQAKTAVQWRGTVPMSRDFSLRADVLWSQDEADERRTKVGLSGAHRGDRLNVLAGVVFDKRDKSSGSTASLESAIQADYKFKPHVAVNAGYALRKTETPTTTYKWNAGVTWYSSDRFAILADSSLLRQLDTNTAKWGSMVGVSRQLSDHMWLTVGYAMDNYVDMGSSGTDFSRTRSGFFIEFEIGFDELSLTRWFSR